ncbi:hypothetical protein [Rathayibacter rathayi]|nr:hypothetical protein [Rathayibacter rathayi]
MLVQLQMSTDEEPFTARMAELLATFRRDGLSLIPKPADGE